MEGHRPTNTDDRLRCALKEPAAHALGRRDRRFVSSFWPVGGVPGGGHGLDRLAVVLSRPLARVASGADQNDRRRDALLELLDLKAAPPTPAPPQTPLRKKGQGCHQTRHTGLGRPLSSTMVKELLEVA